ncbi:hypothetical protein RYX36_010623, partial [Vicia faba]
VRTQLPGAGKKACVNLILSNECGVKLGLTMRESFAAQFMSYSHDNGQLVLILTHGVGKVY